MIKNRLLIPQVASGQVFIHINTKAIKVRQCGGQTHRSPQATALALMATSLLNTNLLFLKPMFPHICSWNNVSPFSMLAYRLSFASFQALIDETLHLGSRVVLGPWFQAVLRVPPVISELLLWWIHTCISKMGWWLSVSSFLIFQ